MTWKYMKISHLVLIAPKFIILQDRFHQFVVSIKPPYWHIIFRAAQEVIKLNLSLQASSNFQADFCLVDQIMLEHKIFYLLQVKHCLWSLHPDKVLTILVTYLVTWLWNLQDLCFTSTITMTNTSNQLPSYDSDTIAQVNSNSFCLTIFLLPWDEA